MSVSDGDNTYFIGGQDAEQSFADVVSPRIQGGEIVLADPSIPPLWGDADRLIQAVLNVVRNAVQALGRQGVITLRTRVQRQYTIGSRRYKLVARLDVIDDGPGIPLEQLEQIFYPMISGRPDGTGLGLSIAQNIVNRHGGLIECLSRPGETVFTLLLPLDKTG